MTTPKWCVVYRIDNGNDFKWARTTAATKKCATLIYDQKVRHGIRAYLEPYAESVRQGLPTESRKGCIPDWAK